MCLKIPRIHQKKNYYFTLPQALFEALSSSGVSLEKMPASPFKKKSHKGASAPCVVPKINKKRILNICLLQNQSFLYSTFAHCIWNWPCSYIRTMRIWVTNIGRHFLLTWLLCFLCSGKTILDKHCHAPNQDGIYAPQMTLFQNTKGLFDIKMYRQYHQHGVNWKYIRNVSFHGTSRRSGLSIYYCSSLRQMKVKRGQDKPFQFTDSALAAYSLWEVLIAFRMFLNTFQIVLKKWKTHQIFLGWFCTPYLNLSEILLFSQKRLTIK